MQDGTVVCADKISVLADCSTSVDLVEEVNELFKIYFVVRFCTGYLDHCCKKVDERGYDAVSSLTKKLSRNCPGTDPLTYFESLHRTQFLLRERRRTSGLTH